MLQYISIWHSKDGLRRQIWEHTDRSVKNDPDVKISEEKQMINWSAAGILQTIKASKLSLFLQGNPLLAPKLLLNSRRFKPIPFWISSPHISALFLHPCWPWWELSTLPRRLKPHPTTASPPPKPHSAQSLLCSNLWFKLHCGLMPLDTLPPDSKSHLWKQMKSM